jgi:hypothetical protein
MAAPHPNRGLRQRLTAYRRDCMVHCALKGTADPWEAVPAQADELEGSQPCRVAEEQQGGIAVAVGPSPAPRRLHQPLNLG